jgi:hypothetical protein
MSTSDNNDQTVKQPLSAKILPKTITPQSSYSPVLSNIKSKNISTLAMRPLVMTRSTSSESINLGSSDIGPILKLADKRGVSLATLSSDESDHKTAPTTPTSNSSSTPTIHKAFKTAHTKHSGGPAVSPSNVLGNSDSFFTQTLFGSPINYGPGKQVRSYNLVTQDTNKLVGVINFSAASQGTYNGTNSLINDTTLGTTTSTQSTKFKVHGYEGEFNNDIWKLLPPEYWPLVHQVQNDQQYNRRDTFHSDSYDGGERRSLDGQHLLKGTRETLLGYNNEQYIHTLGLTQEFVSVVNVLLMNAKYLSNNRVELRSISSNMRNSLWMNVTDPLTNMLLDWLESGSMIIEIDNIKNTPSIIRARLLNT